MILVVLIHGVMGVKNLWPILTPICERKSLWELHDKAVAIDLSCWVCDSQNVENFNQPRMYLRNLFFRTSFLLLLGVKPLFVLEGRAPTLKHDVMSQRVHQRRHNKKQSSSSEEESSKMSQHTRAERNTGSRSRFNSVLKQCEELLTIMGVPCVQSLGEAEALCAKLNEAGLVDGCITQDGDCFLYGAQTVYRNFTISHQGSTGCSVEEYKMDIIEAKLSLSRQKLIALSLFCGCDYNDKGVLGVGKETALKFLEGLEDDKVLPRLKQWRTDPRYEQLETEYAALSNTCSKCSHSGKLQKHAKSGCEACDTRNDCIQTTDTHRLSQKAPEERKAIIAELTMRRKALLDEKFPSQAMVDEFLHRQPLPKFDLSWKQPDIASFIKYSAKLLNWTETYAMEKFIPLVTRWQLHSLEATGNSDQSTLPFIPRLIVKKRVLKGVQSYEVRWKILLCNLEFMEEIVTTEPQEMFGAAYPDLVEEYVKEKESKSRKGKTTSRKLKTKTSSVNTCSCHCKENGEQRKKCNQQSHLCAFVKSVSKSDDVSKIQNILADLDINSEAGRGNLKTSSRNDAEERESGPKITKKQQKLTFNYLYKLSQSTENNLQQRSQKNVSEKNVESGFKVKRENAHKLDQKECDIETGIDSYDKMSCIISSVKDVEPASKNLLLRKPERTGILEEYDYLDADDEIMDMSSIIQDIVSRPNSQF